ncbi:MAG: exo-alpha-sialidase [Chloroflexi bacterium]|nr:MAG: exo-alpha-sialidase [Chloroflexota bacterium]
MRLEVVDEGFVSRREQGTATAVAAGPRPVVTADGRLLCSFMVQPALGVNAFTTVLAGSDDGGRNWTQPRVVWPDRVSRESIFCSLSRGPDGTLFLFGTATPIDDPGESFWSEETQGLKANRLVWAESIDGGTTWSEPTPIPMAGREAAEAAGPMCVTRAGRWLACYCPYPTFERGQIVARDRVVVVASDDRGGRWRSGTMLHFDEPESGAAESWLVELLDGRLLGEAWHMDLRSGRDYPDAYAISHDGGRTWTPTRSTGIGGQAGSLAVITDGRVAFAYNQRVRSPAGVRVALARPDDEAFNVLADEMAWRADTPLQTGDSADHDAWRDFAFGEPALAVLRNGDLLLTFWCVQPSGQGIRFARLRLSG